MFWSAVCSTPMAILQFYIFGKNGKRLFFKAAPNASQEPSEILSGLVFQLAETIKQFDKTNNFRSFATENYSCHVLTTPTGFWFVALCTTDVEDFQQRLTFFYQNIFVQFCLNDFDWDPKNGAFSDEFSQAVRNFMCS